MKNIYLLITIIFMGLNLLAQHNDNEPLEVFNEKDGKGNTVVFAKNNYWCDESVIIEFKVLKNMKVDVELPFEIVVPPKTEKIKLFTISLENPIKESAMSYVVSNCHGNIFKEEYNENEPYFLPYEEGKEFTLDQGYGGSFSHYLANKQNALDFNLPVGTLITASRSGVVVSVKDDSDKHGKSIKYISYGNFITIYHGDGTFSDYYHIQKDGSKVKIGDTVSAGQVIALSGNTGWTSGPHLHFQVYKYSENMEMKTIKTKFLQEDGKLIYLKQTNKYTSFR
jgi:hypothetical protein